MYNAIVPSFLHELCFKQWNYEENEPKYQPVHEGRGLQKCMVLNYLQNRRPDHILSQKKCELSVLFTIHNATSVHIKP